MTKRDFLTLSDLPRRGARSPRPRAHPQGRAQAHPRQADVAPRRALGRHRAGEGEHPDARLLRGRRRPPRRRIRSCWGWKDRSSGAANRSATRRACSPGTATPSLTARRRPVAARADGDRLGARHQRARRRRSPRAGALRRLHHRRVVRADGQPAQITQMKSPSSATARATWRARGSRRRAVRLPARARGAATGTCRPTTSSRAPARTSRVHRDPRDAVDRRPTWSTPTSGRAWARRRRTLTGRRRSRVGR